MDLHIKEKHDIIECSHCGEKLNKLDYTKHRETCKGKDKICEFCGITIIPSEYENHVYMCASKTEPCPACGQNITLKTGMENHLENQCKGKTGQTTNKVTTTRRRSLSPSLVEPTTNNNNNEDRELEEALRLSMQNTHIDNSQNNNNDNLTEEEREFQRILELSKTNF